MQKKNIVALEQLDRQKKGVRGASWLWSNWIVKKHKQRETSQLETTPLLGRTSKKCIMTLMVF
jgi:hypothetical protein